MTCVIDTSWTMPSSTPDGKIIRDEMTDAQLIISISMRFGFPRKTCYRLLIAYRVDKARSHPRWDLGSIAIAKEIKQTQRLYLNEWIWRRSNFIIGLVKMKTSLKTTDREEGVNDRRGFTDFEQVLVGILSIETSKKKTTVDENIRKRLRTITEIDRKTET